MMTAGSSPMKNETLVDLDDDRTLTITRLFNAPPRVVFAAFTEADLVARWWAPTSLGVVVVSIDAEVRVGGKYRYVLRAREEEPIAFSGEYLEVEAPSRLVYTQRFEPFPDPVVVTATFEERGGKTWFTSQEVYPSKEVREAAIASGMEVGMRETMDRLDALAESLHLQ